MIETIYVEEAIARHPRVQQVEARISGARKILCRHYGEVFNRRAQNFRLQKQRPSLILAQKHENHLLKAPDGYGIGDGNNFYFSHMLNCIYDCRYCFLQGMFRSANYVLFVNYEDYFAAMDRQLSSSEGPTYFFSGYDCDSLALDSVTRFVAAFLPYFAQRPRAWLELRTKSVQLRSLDAFSPLPNCVVAFSFTPQAVSTLYEHRVPPVAHRLRAIAELERRGWPIGLRFDPVVYHPAYRTQYRQLFEAVFSRLSLRTLHSVSLGPFRLPPSFFQQMVRLYPDEPLFAGPVAREGGFVAYRRDLEREMLEFCEQELRRFVPPGRLFPCRFRQES